MNPKLDLYLHPLASYCWKVLIALYETETAFEPHVIDLGNAASREELANLWPFAKFPVLRDRVRDRVVPESSVIIEYLALYHPGKVTLLPADPRNALEVRQEDRFYDAHVHTQMQKIVDDRIRPADGKDPTGLARAKEHLITAYDVIETRMATQTWAVGDAFTMADCAAAPALYYANRVLPLGEHRAHASAYLARLCGRPSFARVMKEAEPYFHMFPG